MIKKIIQYLLQELEYKLIRLTGKPNKIIIKDRKTIEIYWFNFGSLGILEVICHRGKRV